MDNAITVSVEEDNTDFVALLLRQHMDNTKDELKYTRQQIAELQLRLSHFVQSAEKKEQRISALHKEIADREANRHDNEAIGFPESDM